MPNGSISGLVVVGVGERMGCISLPKIGGDLHASTACVSQAHGGEQLATRLWSARFWILFEEYVRDGDPTGADFQRPPFLAVGGEWTIAHRAATHPGAYQVDPTVRSCDASHMPANLGV
jgi:hypothetical protein